VFKVSIFEFEYGHILSACRRLYNHKNKTTVLTQFNAHWTYHSDKHKSCFTVYHYTNLGPRSQIVNIMYAVYRLHFRKPFSTRFSKHSGNMLNTWNKSIHRLECFKMHSVGC